MEKIYIANKPAGMTSKDFADIIKKRNNLKKICYCGRLDPMARGKMLFLGDESCKLMPQKNKNNKTYQFEICLGIQTDTDDPLGVIINYNKNFNRDEIEAKIINILKKYNDKEFNQNFHRYSSICIEGKPYWLLTKEKQIVSKIPSHVVKINSIKKIEFFESMFSGFIENIIKTIDKVDRKHDFRQDKIIEQWENFYLKFNETIMSLKVMIDVSSGFYVRQFVQDLSNEINFPLMVFDINRTDINLK
jgi:tRNA pseudouridine(55) synthase